MKSYFKIFFVLVGLFIVGAGFVWGRDNILKKPPINGKKFDDWAVACVQDNASNQEVCFLNQQINFTKDDKTEALASYQIGYFGGSTLQMIQTSPLSINVEIGTTMISGKELIASGKFKICSVGNCQAVAVLKTSDLESIIKNSDNFIGIINAEGKQINLPISNKGLKKALKVLR